MGGEAHPDLPRSLTSASTTDLTADGAEASVPSVP
jgi:hypothetical protein